MYKKLIKLKPENQTIFTTSEIAQILNITNKEKLYSFLKNSTSNNDLIRLTRSVYTLSTRYSQLELGNKLRTPSYISLYTILQKNGIIFQNYESIFLISVRNASFNINNQQFIYKKIKDEVFFDQSGLITNNHQTLATSERAICDLIYLGFDYYFDNLRQIDFALIKNLNNSLYKNKKITNFINLFEKP